MLSVTLYRKMVKRMGGGYIWASYCFLAMLNNELRLFCCKLIWFFLSSPTFLMNIHGFKITSLLRLWKFSVSILLKSNIDLKCSNKSMPKFWDW